MSKKVGKSLGKFNVGTNGQSLNPRPQLISIDPLRLPGDDYKILFGLGEGAYGTVAAAVHKPTGRQVAIKRVLPFEHTLFCLRTLRELKLLRLFAETCVNENVRTDYLPWYPFRLRHTKDGLSTLRPYAAV